MSIRITKTVLEAQVGLLNIMLERYMGPREHPVVLDEAHCYGGYRLDCPEGSPWYPTYTARMSGRELYRAIDGMLTLFEYQAKRAAKEHNKPLTPGWIVVARTPRVAGVEILETDIPTEEEASYLVSEHSLAYRGTGISVWKEKA